MQQQQQQDEWVERLKEMLADSSWFTIAWEWFQTLLGRICDFVLWVTMIFACYQLIPGAPLPDTSVSVTMFVLQFIALDIGGMSLLQIARRRGLGRWSYVSSIAYVLIGITLITIAYSGIQHAVPGLDAHSPITIWVEVVLVVARSVMTVLYGQAIFALKAEERIEQDRVAELEQEVSTLRTKLDSEREQVSSLRVQLSNTVSSVQSKMDREVSSLRAQLDTRTVEVDTLRVQLDKEVSSGALKLDREVSRLTAEMDTLRVQLEAKEQQLTSMKQTMAGGMKWHESNVEAIVSSVQSQLDRERERVSSLQKQLDTRTAELDSERQKVSSATAELDTLRVQLESEVSSRALKLDREVSSVRVQLDAEKHKRESIQQEVEDLRGKLSRKQRELSTLQEQLEGSQQMVSSLQQKILDSEQQARRQGEVDTKVIQLDTNRARKSGQDENAIGEQVRDLLKVEPGLSGRAIATRIGCSPTTATRWKNLIEKGETAI